MQANVTAIKQYHFITVNTTLGIFRGTYSITATVLFRPVAFVLHLVLKRSRVGCVKSKTDFSAPMIGL